VIPRPGALKVTIDNGRTAAIAAGPADDPAWLAPGFIDPQVNGDAGHDVNAERPDPRRDRGSGESAARDDPGESVRRQRSEKESGPSTGARFDVSHQRSFAALAASPASTGNFARQPKKRLLHKMLVL
jgi:hypothetical protein